MAAVKVLKIGKKQQETQPERITLKEKLQSQIKTVIILVVTEEKTKLLSPKCGETAFIAPKCGMIPVEWASVEE